MKALREALLAHYRAHARDLPWRRRRDPYAIWVSEIMLQQTQVETVRERYVRFLAEFPDLASLAAATEERVCEAWAGLGYYRRARHLHRAARILAIERRGAWPGSARELRELPGVGAYTAAAIASIAFGEPVPSVDGNVVRVVARLFALEGRADETALRRRVEAAAAELVRGPAPGDLNQALMDLGATICSPATPHCEVCPVRRFCRARAAGDPERLPAPARRAVLKPLAVAMAWIEDAAGVYLRRRPLDGLWPGLWELPSAEGRASRRALAVELGVELGPRLAAVEHVLSHRVVTASVHRASAVPAAREGLVPYPDPLSAPISALARRVIEAVRARGRGRLRPRLPTSR